VQEGQEGFPLLGRKDRKELLAREEFIEELSK